MAKGYKDSELISARVGASKMGFFTDKQSSNGGGPSSGGRNGTAKKDNGKVLIQEVVAGHFEDIGNKDFKEFNPTHPGGNFAAFWKGIMRSIANGLGVSYNNFANDIESVSFSSIRQGTLTERDAWMMDQKELIEYVCERVYARFLRMFLLSNKSRLPFTKYSKFLADTWHARKWQWVDPYKDGLYNKMLVAERWKSPQMVIRELDLDPDQVLQEFEEWDQMLADHGLKLVQENKPESNNAATQEKAA